MQAAVQLGLIGAAGGVVPKEVAPVARGVEPGAVVGSGIVDDLGVGVGLLERGAHRGRRLGDNPRPPQPLPVKEGVPGHVHAHVVAPGGHVEHVLVGPAPEPLSRNAEKLGGWAAFSQFSKVEHHHARLEVVLDAGGAHLLEKVALDRPVVAHSLADGVGVLGGGKQLARDVGVEELGRVRQHNQVGVKVEGLIHAGEQVGGQQAEVHLQAKMAMSAQAGALDRLGYIQKTYGYAACGGLAHLLA